MLYDGPSAKAAKVLVMSPGSPVEVLSAIDSWVKVREYGGKLAWAEAANVVPRRTVVVTAVIAIVRETDREDAPAVFEAQRGVILDLVESAGGWVKVRHRDGPTGYIRVSEVWGL